MIGSALNCVMAQRIVRKICHACKHDLVPPKEVVSDIKAALGQLYPQKNDQDVRIYQGKGCGECNSTGYMGRVGIFEVLPVTPKISKLILERASNADIKKLAIEEGMITLKQDGYLKVLEGMTTIEEVLRVAQD